MRATIQSAKEWSNKGLENYPDIKKRCSREKLTRLSYEGDIFTDELWVIELDSLEDIKELCGTERLIVDLSEYEGVDLDIEIYDWWVE